MVTCSEHAQRCAAAGRWVLAIIGAASVLVALGSTGVLGGCESDDPGYRKTTSKTTYETPTETTTVTEKREKDTRIYR